MVFSDWLNVSTSTEKFNDTTDTITKLCTVVCSCVNVTSLYGDEHSRAVFVFVNKLFN